MRAVMSNLKSGLRLVAASLTLLASARAFAQDADHQHTDWCYEDGLYDDVKPVDMDPATLKVGFFGKSIAMLAAQAKGFFAAENLSVTYLQIASSEQAFKDLRDGKYDI